jgi:hypothetical protein
MTTFNSELRDLQGKGITVRGDVERRIILAYASLQRSASQRWGRRTDGAEGWGSRHGGYWGEGFGGLWAQGGPRGARPRGRGGRPPPTLERVEGQGGEHSGSQVPGNRNVTQAGARPARVLPLSVLFSSDLSASLRDGAGRGYARASAG